MLHLKGNKTKAQRGLRLSSGHQTANHKPGWDSCEPSHLPLKKPCFCYSLTLLTMAAICKYFTWRLSSHWKFKISSLNSAYPNQLETHSKMRTSHILTFCPLRCFRKKGILKSNTCLFHCLTHAAPLIQTPAFTVSSDSSLWGLSHLQHDTQGTRTQAICPKR